MKKDIRTLSHVPRWAIIRTEQQQSVAEHSYYVALYAAMIYDMIDAPQCDAEEVLWHALVHDIDELVTGDIPSPVKNGIEAPDAHVLAGIGPATTNKEVLKIVKLADILEAVMFIIDDQNLGNLQVEGLLNQLIEIMENRLEEFDIEIRTELRNMVHNNKFIEPELLR